MAKKEEKKDFELDPACVQRPPMSRLARFMLCGTLVIVISFGAGYSCFISTGWLAGWLGTFSVVTFIASVACFFVAFCLAMGVTAKDLSS